MKWRVVKIGYDESMGRLDRIEHLSNALTWCTDSLGPHGSEWTVLDRGIGFRDQDVAVQFALMWG
jgi:hypothetical protein